MNGLPESRVGLSRLGGPGLAAAGCTADEAGGTPAVSTAYADPALLRNLIGEAVRSSGRGEAAHPFAGIVQPGMTVLLKPNWVLHYNKSGRGMDCMITHPAFVREAVRLLLLSRPGRILVADAPIQSTIFSGVATPAWIEELRELGAGVCPVEVLDLRRGLRDGHRAFASKRDPLSSICFDLGADSLLEPISLPAGRFRNTDYDHRVLASAHSAARHQYLLAREAFEADVVINLPKLKTHRKAGLTGALKNLVGLNCDKDRLPHHRVGGSESGGDCYEGRPVLKRAAERFLDTANLRINRPDYLLWRRLAGLCVRAHAWTHGEKELEGSWYGNDTLWRMVLDLNRILRFGLSSGRLSESPVRTVYSLTDAIVAGEADGPLAPEPVGLGAVTFAASSPFADLAHAALMRFDPGQIPLIARAFDPFRYPLAAVRPEDLEVGLDGGSVIASFEEVARAVGRPFAPARFWRGHVELDSRRARKMEGAR